MQTAKYIGKRAKGGEIHVQFEVGPDPAVFSWTISQLKDNIEQMKKLNHPESYIGVFEDALQDCESA